ncbi:MAG TPA: c-type cytochrome [Acidobacteriaceae bacterium]|nr:c-type cytochrome [Acidobacteriaceae bacterium]
MQNRYVAAGILSAALILTPQTIRPQTPQALSAETHGPHGPWPKPTNLHVLPKNISHDDLMKVMHGFTGSLGVKCNYCHAAAAQPRHLDFASDAKPEKRIARTMMRMTRQINQKYLSQVNVADAKPEQKHVTCGTCHRGHDIPVVFVAPPEHKPGMPAATPASNDAPKPES